MLADRALQALDMPEVRGDAADEHLDEVRRDLRRLSADERRLTELRLRLLARQRRELITMASRGELEDSQMWHLQERLDHEEARLELLLESPARPPQAAGSYRGAATAQARLISGNVAYPATSATA